MLLTILTYICPRYMYAYYPIVVAKVEHVYQSKYYVLDSYYGVGDRVSWSLFGVNMVCRVLYFTRILVDSWNIWKRKAVVCNSPFYVSVLTGMYLFLPYLFGHTREGLEGLGRLFVYIVISCVVCAYYFFTRLLAMRCLPLWRVCTQLFGIHFMTDMVSVKGKLPTFELSVLSDTAVVRAGNFVGKLRDRSSFVLHRRRH